MQGRRGQDNQPGRRGKGDPGALNGTGRQRDSIQGTDQEHTVSGITGRFRAIDGAMEQYRNLPPGSTERLRALAQSTGHHRTILNRPADMRRLQISLQTPRIARPGREQTTPQKLRRRLLIVSAIFIVGAVLAFGVGIALFNYVNSVNTSAGAAATATDFLNALNHQDYDQAYKDLGPAITLHLSPDNFKQQAQRDDRCFGAITNYTEVPNSATSPDKTSMAFLYTLTRSKDAKKPFQLHLTLQQDQETNTWKISDYGDTLVPGAASCK